MNFTVLAIHGRYAGAVEFERVSPFIPDEINFKAIDLPGFGSLSEVHRKVKTRDYSNYLNSIIQNLPQPIILLGTDVGCLLALEYCQYHSNSVAGLLLHSFPNDVFPRNIFQELIKPVQSIGKKVTFSNVLGDYENRFNESYKSSRIESEKITKLFNYEWLSSLHSIDNLKAVFLNGAYSKVFSQKEDELMKKILPAHSIVTIPSWRNFPMVELPGDFAQEVIFLASQLLPQPQFSQ